MRNRIIIRTEWYIKYNSVLWCRDIYHTDNVSSVCDTSLSRRGPCIGWVYTSTRIDIKIWSWHGISISGSRAWKIWTGRRIFIRIRVAENNWYPIGWSPETCCRSFRKNIWECSVLVESMLGKYCRVAFSVIECPGTREKKSVSGRRSDFRALCVSWTAWIQNEAQRDHGKDDFRW